MSSQCQPLRGCPQRSYGFQDLKERTKSRCVEHTGKPTRNPPFLPRLCQRRVVGDASWNDWKDWIGIGVTGVILHSGRCSEVAAFCHCAFLLCLCHSICHSVYVCTMLCILAYLFDVLMQLARDSLSTSKSNQCKKWIQMVSCSQPSRKPTIAWQSNSNSCNSCNSCNANHHLWQFWPFANARTSSSLRARRKSLEAYSYTVSERCTTPFLKIYWNISKSAFLQVESIFKFVKL